VPLFVKIDTPTVIFRSHEFNAEYVDGRIDLISDNTPCYLVQHSPNKKFGYDILIVSGISAEKGWEELKVFPRFDEKDPAKDFYELVLASRWSEYKAKENFTEVKHEKAKRVISTVVPPKSKKVQNITTPKPDKYYIPGPEDDKEKPKEKVKEKVKVVPEIPSKKSTPISDGPKLVRDSEVPVYTFDSRRNAR